MACLIRRRTRFLFYCQSFSLPSSSLPCRTGERDPLPILIDIDRYTDDYRQFFTNEASRRGQYIVAGSHLMRKDGAYYNVGHLFAPGGLVHQHVKTHIFPAESDWSTQEGDEMQVLDLPFG